MVNPINIDLLNEKPIRAHMGPYGFLILKIVGDGGGDGGDGGGRILQAQPGPIPLCPGVKYPVSI